MHVPADWFFEFVTGGYIEPWRPESHEQNEVVMAAVAAAADVYAKAGYFTIVEGIVIPRWFLEPLRSHLAGRGHEVAYAILRAPLELCRARVDERGGEPIGAPEVVENVWREFADIGEWERHVIEVGARDPEAVADELASRIESGELFLRKLQE